VPVTYFRRCFDGPSNQNNRAIAKRGGPMPIFSPSLYLSGERPRRRVPVTEKSRVGIKESGGARLMFSPHRNPLTWGCRLDTQLGGKARRACDSTSSAGQ
jgi:hypothetical protein